MTKKTLTISIRKPLFVVILSMMFPLLAGAQELARTTEMLRNISTPQRPACAQIRSEINGGNPSFPNRRENISRATYYITPVLNAFHRGEFNLQGAQVYQEGNSVVLRNVSHREPYVLNNVTRLQDLPPRVCPFGYGSSGPNDRWDTTNCLDPCTTVASDGNYRKGDVIFIPSMVNRICPHTGQPIDGCFMVSDVGDAIRGRGRFDFFTGICPGYRPNSSSCPGGAEFIQGLNGDPFYVIPRDTENARRFRAQQAEIINNRWPRTGGGQQQREVEASLPFFRTSQ